MGSLDDYRDLWDDSAMIDPWGDEPLPLCVDCDEEPATPGSILCLWCQEADDDECDPDEYDPY